MATRLKTVHYAFPTLASLTNNTLTNLTQRTLYLSESGAKTISSVVAHVTFDDIITATGGSLTTKTLALRLGAAAYTTIANANTLTNTGENASFHLVADFTSHFVSNWTGTSMTCDFQLQINQSTGTTLGMVNVCVTLEITYEYDDTSSTQLKTVFVPLDAPTAALATTATTVDTFPALDTYLPEASKTYRGMYVVVQGNMGSVSTNDHTITVSVGGTTVTTGNYESALASERWFRYVFEIQDAGFTGTGSTQNFQLSATVARCHHLQAYAVITYEYSEASTTSVMNSVLLPMTANGPMGGTTSADFQSGALAFDIEEPGTITTNRVAFFPFWGQAAAIAGLNMRIGTGSFVTYTDAAAALCGSNGAMVRNDTAFALARGRNTLTFDAYRTDTADFGFGLSGFWLVNYTSGKANGGTGSHNHTVFDGLIDNGTAAAAAAYTSASVGFAIPESDYCIVNAGVRSVVQLAGATPPALSMVRVERLSGEGGHAWFLPSNEFIQTDTEIGAFHLWGNASAIFGRWPNDADSKRVDIETARRWELHVPSNASTAGTAWGGLSLLVTYHTILSTVDGTVTGSSGGTVNIRLQDDATGETLKTASRTGNGAYSIPFYGASRQLYTTAREGSTLLARSDTGTATLV